PFLIRLFQLTVYADRFLPAPVTPLHRYTLSPYLYPHPLFLSNYPDFPAKCFDLATCKTLQRSSSILSPLPFSKPSSNCNPLSPMINSAPSANLPTPTAFGVSSWTTPSVTSLSNTMPHASAKPRSHTSSATPASPLPDASTSNTGFFSW